MKEINKLQCHQCCWVGEDEELKETTKLDENKSVVPDYVCPKCGCSDLSDIISETEWDCPDCNFNPPEFEGEFYKFNHDKNKIEYKHFEDGVEVSKDYYPKFGPRSCRGYDSGFDWEEIHYCPNCKKEFSFCNGT